MLEKSFGELSARLQRLRDRLRELRVTVVEDRPARQEAVVVDTLEYAIEDLLGWVEELLQHAAVCRNAVGHPIDFGQARTSLSTCQNLFSRMQQTFSGELNSYERLKDLTTFGQERRGEWKSWVASVRLGIDQCSQPLSEAGQALADCWQEIAEHSGGVSVSVRNTSIGQRITTAKSTDPDWVGQGLT
jgi:hypothetical protein